MSWLYFFITSVTHIAYALYISRCYQGKYHSVSLASYAPAACARVQADAGRRRQAAWPPCAEPRRHPRRRPACGSDPRRAVGADTAVSPVPAESHHAARDTILSAGSKGQAANFHFVPVSVFAHRKWVQFHQIQGKEPGETGEMATLHTVPARGLPAPCRRVRCRLGLPLPTSETSLTLDVCPFFFPFLHAA